MTIANLVVKLELGLENTKALDDFQDQVKNVTDLVDALAKALEAIPNAWTKGIGAGLEAVTALARAIEGISAAAGAKAQTVRDQAQRLIDASPLAQGQFAAAVDAELKRQLQQASATANRLRQQLTDLSSPQMRETAQRLGE